MKPLVVILPLCHAKAFRDEVKISNTFDITKLIVDNNMKEIARFIKSVKNMSPRPRPINYIIAPSANTYRDDSNLTVYTTDQVLICREVESFGYVLWSSLLLFEVSDSTGNTSLICWDKDCESSVGKSCEALMKNYFCLFSHFPNSNPTRKQNHRRSPYILYSTSPSNSSPAVEINWTGIMSLVQPYWPRGDHFYNGAKSSHGRNNTTGLRANYDGNYDSLPYNSNFYITNYGSSCVYTTGPNHGGVWPEVVVPSSKRRKISDFSCESNGPYQQQLTYGHGLQNHANMWQHVPFQFFNAYCKAPSVCDNSSAVSTIGDSVAYASTASKRDRSKSEDEEEVVFMSRDEIEGRSPSRKDGIDVLQETRLRYSYCDFLQNLGVRLDLPQTTIGTAMVLCHRFFFRRSHASHDRFLIATATLFLTSKAEETPRSLSDVIKVSSEVLHGQDFVVLSYMLPIDWFEQYRERIIEAEQLILTTLNFELGVQHPFESLTSTLRKLGFSQSAWVNLALSLISEGFRSSLWLQFKPHQIAAGAAYLAAKCLNLNLASWDNVWHEFHTSPSVLRDVAHQLMELF